MYDHLDAKCLYELKNNKHQTSSLGLALQTGLQLTDWVHLAV